MVVIKFSSTAAEVNAILGLIMIIESWVSKLFPPASFHWQLPRYSTNDVNRAMDMAIHSEYPASPLPTPRSLGSGIAKETIDSHALQSPPRKPTSESNLSDGRNLSELGLRSISAVDQASSPSGDSHRLVGPNARKRPSYADDETAPPSKTHNRSFSGSDIVDRRLSEGTQQSSPHDPTRDTMTARASPTRVPSVRAQPIKSTRAGLFPTMRSGTPTSVTSQSKPSLGSKATFELQKPPSASGSQPFKAFERNASMLLQPETRPITQDQLVNEVKGTFLI